MSLWCDLYPTISADIRFTNMLAQPGTNSKSNIVGISPVDEASRAMNE